MTPTVTTKAMQERTNITTKKHKLEHRKKRGVSGLWTGQQEWA